MRFIVNCFLAFIFKMDFGRNIEDCPFWSKRRDANRPLYSCRAEVITTIWQKKNGDTLYVLFFQKKFKQNNFFCGQMKGYHIVSLKQNGLKKTHGIQNGLENMIHLLLEKQDVWQVRRKENVPLLGYFKPSMPVV